MDLICKKPHSIVFPSPLQCWGWFVPALGAPAPGEGRGWSAVGAEGGVASAGTAGAAGPGAPMLTMAAAPSGSRGETWTLQHSCSLLLQHKYTRGKP